MTHHLHTGEQHRGHRRGWLRAAILGANDGIVSTASLIIGVSASSATKTQVIVAGIAGVVAGAMSMSAGEYVSVKAQADTEEADIEVERRSLESVPELELLELTEIYEERGLDAALARQVAEQLTAHDALGAHVRDELGHSEESSANPVQAAVTSGVAFALFATIPVLVVSLTTDYNRVAVVALSSLLLLVALGAAGAEAGGASKRRGALRVAVGGSLAMTATAIIGSFVGAII